MPAFWTGPVPVKAGDPAPHVIWNRVLQQPAGSTDAPGLFGRVSVICFLPNLSANASFIAHWNELARRFADKPVNFLLIASESGPALEGWLREHPVGGWLLLDPDSETAHAYGAETVGAAIVDFNGKIAGFAFMVPDERQIRAVLEGRAIAVEGDPSEAQMNDILAGRAVRLEAEPFRAPGPAPKPDIPPSYTVHIAPAETNGTESDTGPDHWVRRGFGLKAILSEVYDTEPSRIVLPASLDNGGRFDFVLVLPREEDQEEIHLLVRQAVEKHFQIAIATEIRPADVYVMTAMAGKTPPESKGEGHGGGIGSMIWSTSWTVAAAAGTPPTDEAIRKAVADSMLSDKIPAVAEISAENRTIDDFRRHVLEESLDRPVVDETNLKGAYDLSIHSTGGGTGGTESLLEILQNRLGLVLTPTRRDIEMLVVTPLAR